MRTCVAGLLVAGSILGAASASAQTPPAAPAGGPLSGALQRQYANVKRNITEAAEKMADADYAFRPVDSVNTFGGFVGHIADANFAYCSAAAGDKNPSAGGLAKLATKAELVAALAKAFAYCDVVYNGMTDEKLAAIAKMAQGEPVGALLFGNVSHTNEHYGNLVTYMRIKGLVPPSTERSQRR